MRLNIASTIDTPDAPVLLSTALIKEGKVLENRIEKACFVLEQLNNENYTRYSVAPQKIEPTLTEAQKWLISQKVAKMNGEGGAWFVYDKQTNKCVGLVNIQKTGKNSFEIGQLAIQKDYDTRYNALKIIESQLSAHGSVRKISIRVPSDNIDSTYHSFLRGLGYSIENVTHNRLLKLDNKDDVVYTKFKKEQRLISRFKHSDIYRVLPCQLSNCRVG